MDILLKNNELFDQNSFDTIANDLLNHTYLIVNEKQFRICEIEFYHYSESHKDCYVHRNPDQSKYGKYYFHKYGTGTYKSGTYKGLDLTFGNDDVFCGILIRSIYDVENDEMIEGPCRSVNRILEEYGLEKVMDFTSGKLLDITNNEHDFIIKTDLEDPIEKEKVYKGMRVGLSDKYPEYKIKKYRYLIMKNKIKKQKKDLELLII
jgi:3-methyladenine DNA glycosylase Mpg